MYSAIDINSLQRFAVGLCLFVGDCSRGLVRGHEDWSYRISLSQGTAAGSSEIVLTHLSDIDMVRSGSSPNNLLGDIFSGHYSGSATRSTIERSTLLRITHRR